MLRKIRTKEEIKKKDKQNQIIIGVVMVGILVLSTAGFSLLSADNSNERVTVTDSGFEFYSEGGYWTLDVGGQLYRFYYLPSQVVNVTLEGTFKLADYTNKPLYFVGEITDAIVTIPCIVNSLHISATRVICLSRSFNV